MPEGSGRTVDSDRADSVSATDATLGAATQAGEAASASRSAGTIEPAQGSMLGRYVVLSRIGAGAMGVVLAAYDPELDRKVALKLLDSRPADDQEAARARVQREAQALAKLNHPNVVAVHDVGVHEGRVFIAMEFVQGQTLRVWMKAAPSGRRPWKEVVTIFDAAGEGLAAAHAAGLVHRDFKPDNVLLDASSERVRVSDFGLARASNERSPSPGSGEPEAEQDLALERGLDLTRTRTGALMGTPAYMAPEQFQGEVTPRSDQFAFCVAMFEALHGVRPFKGETLEQLTFKRDLVDAPRGVVVPPWLRGVLRRGLSPDPADRFDTMTALLAALRSGEVRHRRRRLLGISGAFAVILLGVVGYRQWDEAQRTRACVAEGDGVDEVWNESARQRLREGVLATEVSYAESTAQRALPYFEAQAEALRAARTQVCLDTRVRGQWTPELLLEATGCLDERLAQLEALAEELSEADDVSVRRAVTAASKLAPVDSCLDIVQLRRAPDPPADLEAVRTIRATLSRSKALSLAGKLDQARTLARDALGRADVLGWPVLEAASRVRLGGLLCQAGKRAEAEQLLEEAYFAAARTGAHEEAFDAAGGLMQCIGKEPGRYAEALRWSRHAEVALSMLGGGEDEPRRAMFFALLGNVQTAAGEYEEAEASLKQAISLKEAALGPEHPDLAASLNDLAVNLRVRGDYVAAENLYRRALGLYESTLGPNHPEVAAALNNLANVRVLAGDLAEAKSLLGRAIEIWEAALGPEHPDLATGLNNLGILHYRTGDDDQSESVHARALAIREAALGPDDPAVAMSLDNLCIVHIEQGRLDEAQALAERALSIYRRALGPEHPTTASPLINLGSIFEVKGEYERAESVYTAALKIREQALGPTHPQLHTALRGLAEVFVAKGQPGAAVPMAQRALDVQAEAGLAPETIAYSRFLLAQVLWEAPPSEGGDRTRARALAEQARDTFASSEIDEQEAAEVERWLAEHDG